MAIERCMILTSGGEPIAEGVVGHTEDGRLSVKVLNDDVSLVAQHEVVLIVGGEGDVPKQCMLLEQQGSYVMLKVLDHVDGTMRQNVRVPVKFRSFLYPVNGTWKGRRELTSVDLSSSGIAFYSTSELQEGERAEVVIPVTSSPLLVQLEILGRQELKDDRAFYKAQFADLQQDQEHMIREAVFSLQLENRARQANAEREKRR